MSTGTHLLVVHRSPGGVQTCSLGSSTHSPCPLMTPQICAVLCRGLPTNHLEGHSFQAGPVLGWGHVLLRRDVLGAEGSESGTWDVGGAFGVGDPEGKKTDGEGADPGPAGCSLCSCPGRGLGSASASFLKRGPHGLVCTLCTAVLTDNVILRWGWGGGLRGRGDCVRYPALKTWCPCSVSPWKACEEGEGVSLLVVPPFAE